MWMQTSERAKTIKRLPNRVGIRLAEACVLGQHRGYVIGVFLQEFDQSASVLQRGIHSLAYGDVVMGNKKEEVCACVAL
jgi:hypothetical protein